jgi:anti-sigma B factor antagonist
MEIRQRTVDDVTIIDMKGKLTLGDGDELLREQVNSLIQQGQKKIVLNLADVPYVDSAGLGEIVRAHTVVLRNGGRLNVLRPTKRVQDLLRVTKIQRILEAFELEADAVRRCSTPPGS